MAWMVVARRGKRGPHKQARGALSFLIDTDLSGGASLHLNSSMAGRGHPRLVSFPTGDVSPTPAPAQAYTLMHMTGGPHSPKGRTGAPQRLWPWGPCTSSRE